MAGHSKWNNIKRKKEASDAKKAQIFTKIGRKIAIALRDGSPDPAINSALRDVIATAKSLNVPNDNIQRMIAKYSGANADSAAYESITYEGYGPGGVAVIVETLTDNRNRTAGEMRHYFDKCGGNLGATNCVSWQFSKRGIIVIENEGQDEDEIMMQALEAGADDVIVEEEMFEIVTSPESFSSVRDALEQAGYAFAQAEVSLVTDNMTTLTNEDDIKNMQKLLSLLDDNDDVQNVYHNWENETDE
ncbi:MAG TPA: YebC/PmpR family DNA-binding transcriptional regulator [Clostridiales bacterium]|nr:YebC/PmpR family DNA-binding transcriptional regulator [Clostridiales bacterium]